MNIRWTKLFRQSKRAPEILRCAGDCESWAALSLAYIGVRPLAYPYVVPFRDGSRLRLETFYDLTTFWPVFFAPAYPVRVDESVIVDAGANIGTFTLYAARAAPKARIWALEPFGSTFLRLTDTVAANRLSGRVECLQCALGSYQGEAHMQDGDRPSQFRQIVATGGVITQVTTLEALFRDYALDQIDLVKMDIEGGEFPSILSSAPEVLRRIRRLCLEYHPSYTGEPCSKDSLLEHLKVAGFQCLLDRPDGGGYGIAHFERTEPAPRR